MRLVVALLLVVASPALRAQYTERMSVDSSGAEGDDPTYGTAISGDGRFVVFVSDATNLVPNDTNGVADVFVHDRESGVTERVNVDSSGNQADNRSEFSNSPLGISADGRFVVFTSAATNLVSNDTNLSEDVFVHDRQTGATERVSVDSQGNEADSHSFRPRISADGRIVAFSSFASNLVAGDANGKADVFVHDRQTGATERVSVDSAGGEANGDGEMHALSADGNCIAFISDATNLVANDSNGWVDVFVHDRTSGVTSRVSVDSAGNESDGFSIDPELSADGSVVAFISPATNLVANDTNQRWDAFVHDRTTGITERISVDAAGNGVDGDAGHISISDDGQVVAFDDGSRDLVAGDLNGAWDVFVHYRSDGHVRRVSVDAAGNEVLLGGHSPRISGDGRVVLFSSDDATLVANDTNQCVDAFTAVRYSPASWTNYGSGLAGSYGVPTLAPTGMPALGTTLTVDVSNSLGGPTTGLLVVGLQRTQLHSRLGGDLLVVPTLVKPITFSYGGDSFSGVLPADPVLVDVAVDLQVVEADPGAVKGVSFTPGLELVLGW